MSAANVLDMMAFIGGGGEEKMRMGGWWEGKVMAGMVRGRGAIVVADQQ